MCLGMGGSAAGGDFLAALTEHDGGCPVVVRRGYSLPAWFDATWLVLATSHSGNTEETVAAAEAALKMDATVVVIATGGVLAGLPELFPRCYLIPTVGGQPPRTAFGHIFSRQVAVMEHLGLLTPQAPEQRASMLERLEANNHHFDVLSQPEGDIALLAAALMDQPIAVIGPSELSPALNRFKNQMNENAARFVRIGVIPEMNHNESVHGEALARTVTEGERASPPVADLARHAPACSAATRLDGGARLNRNGVEPRRRRHVALGVPALPLFGHGLAFDHAGVPPWKRPRCHRPDQRSEGASEFRSVKRAANQTRVRIERQGVFSVFAFDHAG